MIRRLLSALRRLLNLPNILGSELRAQASKEDIDSLKAQNGRLWHKLNKNSVGEIVENIQLAEFKVFSQFGDDGIIQFLVDYLEIGNRTFVEFGVENYKESNTRFLLINNNWKGLIIDGSDQYIAQIKREEIYWKFDLDAVSLFITRENINDVIASHGFNGEIGLLHIDIDGNDYWIWKEIDVISPVIAIIEYNSVLGCDKPLTIEYDPSFQRTDAHFSNLYYGASLPALCELADEKGYHFIGCNSNGNNAYFIKKDKIRNLRPLTAKEGFVYSKFKEARDASGALTYSTGASRYDIIRGLKIYNSGTGSMEIL